MLGDSQNRLETPIKLVPLGYNSTANSDLIITAGSRMGDLAGLVSSGVFGSILSNAGTVQVQNPVRIPKPHSGEITNLYLTFRLRLGDDETGTRSMWLGYANPKTGSEYETKTMVLDEILKVHEAVRGTSDPFQAGAGEYIQFNRLDITELIRRGTPGLGWHGLLFQFDQKPVRNYDINGFAIANGYALEVFRLEAVIRFKGTI